MFESAKKWARSLKRDVVALFLAARDPRVPWFAKLAAACVAAYALSPIDLIPDFIPVLGYLDDLLIVPLGILLVTKIIPPVVMADLRHQADLIERPVSRTGLVVIVALWIAGGLAIGWFVFSQSSDVGRPANFDAWNISRPSPGAAIS